MSFAHETYLLHLYGIEMYKLDTVLNCFYIVDDVLSYINAFLSDYEYYNNQAEKR